MGYSFQKFEFSFYYNTILSETDFFALNGVIHVRTLRHINDDIALHEMSAKTEIIEAGEEKVKISANPDKLITNVFLAIELRK